MRAFPAISLMLTMLAGSAAAQTVETDVFYLSRYSDGQTTGVSAFQPTCSALAGSPLTKFAGVDSGAACRAIAASRLEEIKEEPAYSGQYLVSAVSLSSTSCTVNGATMSVDVCTVTVSVPPSASSQPATCHDPVNPASGGVISLSGSPGTAPGNVSTAPGLFGDGRQCAYNFDDKCKPKWDPVRSAVGFFVCGFFCGAAATEADCPLGISETNHWTHIDPQLVTVSGLVAGGEWYGNTCPNGLECSASVGVPSAPSANSCKLPKVSGGDWGYEHRDRDFEFHVLPLQNDSLDGRLLSSRNFETKDGGGFPSLGVEIEYMYFYPRPGPITGWFPGPNPRPDQAAHFSLSLLGQTLPPTYVADGATYDFPTVGDQVVTRGVPIWDCGHASPSTGAYSTELHPPVAAAWLHPTGSKTSRLVVKALSHAPYPAQPPGSSMGSVVNFDMMDIEFTVPGYDAGRALCIGDPVVDYNAAMQQVSSFNNGLRSGDPYAVMTAGPDLDFNYWTLNVASAGNGRIHVHVEPNFPGGNESNIPLPTGSVISSDFPLMMGAHLTVCQPDFSGGSFNGCGGHCVLSTAQMMDVVQEVLR